MSDCIPSIHSFLLGRPFSKRSIYSRTSFPTQSSSSQKIIFIYIPSVFTNILIHLYFNGKVRYYQGKAVRLTRKLIPNRMLFCRRIFSLISYKSKPPVKRVVCTRAKSPKVTGQRLKALAFTFFKGSRPAFASFAAP